MKKFGDLQQNGQHFADILKCIFLKEKVMKIENFRSLISIGLKFVHKSLINKTTNWLALW